MTIQRNEIFGLAREASPIFVRETAILVGVAVALPLLIHLIPYQAVPWGARLLPMFYAPLLGVILYRLSAGIVPALLAPILNLAITGQMDAQEALDLIAEEQQEILDDAYGD